MIDIGLPSLNTCVYEKQQLLFSRNPTPNSKLHRIFRHRWVFSEMSSLKWTFTLVFHEKFQQQRSFNNKMMDFVSALEGLKIPPTTNERSTSSTVIQHIMNVYCTIGILKMNFDCQSVYVHCPWVMSLFLSRTCLEETGKENPDITNLRTLGDDWLVHLS